MGRRWLLFMSLVVCVHARSWFSENIRMPGADEEDGISGTRWAVLVAGSSGYGNYRHQSDVCHAYQILRRNGITEEHIVVMMYDDIADSPENPRPGVIINHPHGSDNYAGVPKDYTGSDVTADNLYAVILGDKNSTRGGSGKVINSGPNDHVFLFYSDHGGPGVLGMPGVPFVYANDLVEVLKTKQANGGFEEMVIYLEACESGSIFEGLLPEGLGIYVTTASNAEESSWGTYCPGSLPAPPPEFSTCLGDLYSVAWMEDSETHNLKKETLLQQYLTVKDRTSNHKTYHTGSHVMQYGDVDMNVDRLSKFIGFDPANLNLPPYNHHSSFLGIIGNSVNQRDADLLHLWHKYNKASEGTQEKLEARENMMNAMAHRIHLDKSVQLVGEIILGTEKAHDILASVRPSGKVLVDDWDCLKSMVRAFESKCGPLQQYGMKHMRAFANICNEGVEVKAMISAASKACYNRNSDNQLWMPVSGRFSA